MSCDVQLLASQVELDIDRRLIVVVVVVIVVVLKENHANKIETIVVQLTTRLRVSLSMYVCRQFKSSSPRQIG